jgi:hypothetical protein
MNRRNILGLSTVAAFGLALLPSGGVAQQKTLKDQLVGTWTLVSTTTTRPDGTRYDAVGPNAKGTFMLEASGRFSLLLLGDARRKFASNNRLEGTPEENTAAVHGAIAYFGTYTVSEADHAINFHVEKCTFPNWDETDQKRLITITGDEMKYTNPAASGGGKAELVFTRAK